MREHGGQEAPVPKGFHILGCDEYADEKDGHHPLVGRTQGPDACSCPGCRQGCQVAWLFGVADERCKNGVLQSAGQKAVIDPTDPCEVAGPQLDSVGREAVQGSELDDHLLWPRDVRGCTCIAH